MSRTSRLFNLKDRFLDGEKLTVKEIVDDYFAPRSPYGYLLCAKKVKSHLGSIKRKFRKEGLWFGCLNEQGVHGIATTQEEVRWAIMAHYRFVKGNILSARLLVSNARQKGILPSGVSEGRMLIAKFDEPERPMRRLTLTK